MATKHRKLQRAIALKTIDKLTETLRIIKTSINKHILYRKDIDMIYIEKVTGRQSMEEAYLPKIGS